MRYYEIAPTKIIRSGSDFFTYHSDKNLAVGQIVQIPVGKKQAIGVILGEVQKPKFETREIESVVVKRPIPAHLLNLTKWISQYYGTPLAQVLSGVLPSGVQKTRRKPAEKVSEPSVKYDRTNFLFTADQQAAIQKLDSIESGTVILHGKTGSGKTAVYIDQAKKVIDAQKSVILLVPEIALTSQLVKNFEQTFDNIKLIHSRMTEAERHKVWLKTLEDDSTQIIIGARSALFSPVQNLGLVIIDEAHEPSFKQEQTPKYSALRASSFLAHSLKIKTILGSATPLVEDYFLAEKSAQNSQSPIIKMDQLAKSTATPPKIELVDLTKKHNLSKHRFFSNQLLKQISASLDQNKQVLIYHNRRGSASITTCHECGWMALCSHCFLPMTLHIDKHKLVCHVCGQQEKIPTACPVCGEAEIIHKGIGTKMIEDEIRKLFPSKNIARFDADSEKDQTVEKLYDEIVSGELDIIIGTQVIAKGLDMPKLQTVGVVQADAGLALPDFTSSERNFQLLAQVIGRVGRHASDTNVIVQTYQPDSPSIQFGIKQDYDGFYKHEIVIREKTNFPPFVYMLKLTCVYKTERSAIKNARAEATAIRAKFGKNVQILGPTPAFYERVGETYRWQIVIKSKKRGDLQKIAAEFISKPHWRVDIDPPSLL